MTKAKKDYDVIIVGGGLAGLTLACLLGTHKFSVLCLDRDPPVEKNNKDARATVLSHGTSLVLKEAGLWDKIEPLACPIHKIDILDGNSPVLMDFLSKDVDGIAFGHNIENARLRVILANRAAQLKSVTHLCNAEVSSIDTSRNQVQITTADKQKFTASLLIGADGRNSFIRKFLNVSTHGWSYDQTAIVATLEHENPHDNVAIEHFRSEGPLAILPLPDLKNTHRSTLVWTVETKNAKTLLAMDDDIFALALCTRAPEQYGAIKLLSKRMSYPLSLQHAHSYIGERIALIADAAHGMHPIAGQGLNMGMRDIKTLSDLLIEARDEKEDLGSDNVLKKFQRARHFDNMAMMAATDGLNKLFSNDLPLVGHLRRLGISLIDKIPPAKKFFMSQAMGLKNGR